MNVNPVQLFDVESSTLTYILVADDEKSAVIIDPVERHWERDVAHLVQLSDGDVIGFGADERIEVLHTPGHTAGSISFAWRRSKPKLIDIAVPANRNLGLHHGA